MNLTQVGTHHTQVDGNELVSLQQSNHSKIVVDTNSTMPVAPVEQLFTGQNNGYIDQNVVNIPPVNPINQILPVVDMVNQGANTAENVMTDNQVSQPKRASALSLASIRNRKELASSLEKNVINPDDLPKEPFTYNQLMEEWNYYTDRLLRGGLPLMASLMGMSKPELNGARIELELPNAGSKLSFEENKYDLVNYLRKKLQNFDIELTINVNEEIKLVKRVLDSKDKYQHFVNINPEIEILKEMFDLDLK